MPNKAYRGSHIVDTITPAKSKKHLILALN